jgi:hypothetical protein
MTLASPTIKKRSTDGRTYYMDFSDELADGDTIASVTSVTETSGHSGLNLSSAAVVTEETTIHGVTLPASQAASVFVDGGTNRTLYLVTFTVLTTDGDTIARTGPLEIDDDL